MKLSIGSRVKPQEDSKSFEIHMTIKNNYSI